MHPVIIQEIFRFIFHGRELVGESGMVEMQILVSDYSYSEGFNGMQSPEQFQAIPIEHTKWSKYKVFCKILII